MKCKLGWGGDVGSVCTHTEVCTLYVRKYFSRLLRKTVSLAMFHFPYRYSKIYCFKNTDNLFSVMNKITYKNLCRNHVLLSQYFVGGVQQLCN